MVIAFLSLASGLFSLVIILTDRESGTDGPLMNPVTGIVAILLAGGLFWVSRQGGRYAKSGNPAGLVSFQRSLKILFTILGAWVILVVIIVVIFFAVGIPGGLIGPLLAP